MNFVVNAIDRHIGGRVRNTRIFRNFSISRMADELRISVEDLEQHECGAKRFSAVHMLQLSRLLRVEASFFLRGFEVRVTTPASTSRDARRAQYAFKSEDAPSALFH